MSDSRVQEIVTKAVVGRAERRVTWGHTVPAEGVTSVLGVHVTNSTVSVSDEDGTPKVDLLVDCDLWCSGSKQTKVMRCTGRNSEAVQVHTMGKILGDRDMRATLLGPARATGVNVADGKITLRLEADVAVEMSALTRLWVKAYDFDSDVLEDLEGSDWTGSGSGSGAGTGSGTGSGAVAAGE